MFSNAACGHQHSLLHRSRSITPLGTARSAGLDGALAKLADRSYGPLALGVVAAGLIAFALYSLSDARYHRI